MTPANLIFRFLLELAALAGFATLAWNSTEGAWRYPVVAATLTVLAALWGVFNVPDDPSRSGHAPVVVPGLVRLILELAILIGGGIAFAGVGHTVLGGLLVAGVVVHYALSRDRIMWLLAH